MPVKVRKNDPMHADLYLEVISGPSSGRAIKIQEGLRVGRSRGEFRIDDPRISSLHAQIIKHSKGIFVLLDQQSHNKILFNGERVDKIALMPGIQFILGDTKFRVSDQAPSLAASPSNELIVASKDIAPSAFLGDLNAFLSQDRHISMPVEIQFFETPLWLVFEQGPEFGRSLGLTYGPRFIGRESKDIILSEPSAPPTAFSLVPTLGERNSVNFVTQYPAIVRLNGESIQKQCIQKSSTVQIGKTRITLLFSEER